MSFEIIYFPNNQVLSNDIVIKILNEFKNEGKTPILVPFLNDAPIVAELLSCKKICCFIEDEGVIIHNRLREETISEITYEKALNLIKRQGICLQSEFVNKCKDFNIEVFIGNDRKNKGTTIKNSISHN